ncbi:MAG: M24 family metallopeptidase [Solirubrobacterales bacterium]
MAAKSKTPTLADIPHVNGFPRHSEGEMARRHAGLQGMMEEHDLAAVVIVGATGPLETSVIYYTNWPPLVESHVVATPDGEMTLFVRLWNHFPDARITAAIDDVRYGGDSPPEAGENVAAELKKRGAEGKRIGVIGPQRHADALIMQKALPGSEWVDLNTPYRALRLFKSEEELMFMRLAASYNDRAVEAMEAQIKPGINEREIAQMVEDTYLSEGAENLIHFTLSTPMDDPQYCVPHQLHPDRVIQSGDVVVTEISTTFWGYAGQILRTFTVDAEPTPLYKELHDVAESTWNDMTGIIKTGVTIGELLDQADQIEQAGFTIYDDLIHGFGGAYLPPISRTRHSRGSTHPEDFAYDQAGTVLVIQPNIITTDEKAGVQLGNSFVIQDDGIENLQKYPNKRIRVG